MYSLTGRKAPFRISSTPKGGEVYPGVYYLIEDIVAVNAGAGRPFREALAARYIASPRFRRMIKVQSLFWSIPSLIVAIVCTIIIVIHPISKEVGYGIGTCISAVVQHIFLANVQSGWGVPFLWMGIWTAISVPWIRRDMHLETITWEEDFGIVPEKKHKHATPDTDQELPPNEPKLPEPVHT